MAIRITYFYQKIQQIFWPIEKSETKLFISLGLMMLCMLFNFAVLRSIKDGLVIPTLGAEVISFLKLWLVMPTTIVFTIAYAKLSNMLSYDKLFYLIISCFLVFFVAFIYILLPQQHILHPSEATIAHLITSYPHCKWFIKIMSKWIYALMYVFCELWGVVIINLLFWQYANHIFDSRLAKVFYPFLGIIGNVGLVVAGGILSSFSNLSDITDMDVILQYNNDAHIQFELVLKPIMLVVVAVGLMTISLYAYIDKYVVGKKGVARIIPHLRGPEQTKTVLSLRDSLKMLLRSKYIGHVMLLVLCYGVLINLLEGTWKAKIGELYPNTIDYINFMGNFNIWMGVLSIFFMIIGSNILRNCSWLTAALITPYMIACTGCLFFLFVILASNIQTNSTWFNPLYWAVSVGAVQNILSKATKYSLFDSTKEMAYIPLSLELRTKGKAVVEVVGLKFGKSIGAFWQSMIFIIMPMATFDSLIIYFLVIFVLVLILWIWNIRALNEEYLQLIKLEKPNK